MRIKEITIDNYRHLENLTFDFTYPEGHAKAGQILEKICLIGQSATGKTSILELIRDSVELLSTVEIVNADSLWGNFHFSLKGTIKFQYDDNELIIAEKAIKVGDKMYTDRRVSGGSITGLDLQFVRLIYIAAEIISKNSLSVFSENPLNIMDANYEAERHIDNLLQLSTTSYLYEFSQDIQVNRWHSLLSKILDYRKKFTQMASELINKGAIGDLNKLNKHFEIWSQANKNPLIPFADHFDPILKKLGLKIDLVSTEYPVPIKSIVKDDIVPITNLSTGTKSLLLSTFPLFELDTKAAVILLDEPERSLFPDVQMELMDHYSRSAPEAQFIVATHSPFIAASFEPEERFILYFNNDNKVCIRRGQSPVGDDPNDLLRNDFNVDYYNRIGRDAYTRYLKLKADVHSESDPLKKTELMRELVDLGDKYNF